MKKRLKEIVALTLSVLMLTACAANTDNASTSSPDSTTGTTDQTSEMEAEADTEAAAIGASDSLNANISADFGDLFATYSPRMGGGFMPDLEPKSLAEYSEEDIERIDRAMRDYKPSGKSLLVNKAKNYYFYDSINQTEKDIYDAIYMLAEDPTTTDNAVAFRTNDNVESEAFGKDLQIAFLSLMADHPELFWLNNGIKTDITMGYGLGSAGYKYTVYFQFTSAYKDFSKDMEAFNKATDSFLKGINLKQDDYLVAKDIHDKLISTVVYDDVVCEQNLGRDLAHTAYGALVANSRGNKNTAVCDGYSYAYLYLLQQAGIDASMVYGYGGTDEKNSEPHAWNVVKLGNDWYEVDSTWDDMLDTFEALKKDPQLPKESLPFVELPLKDPECGERITHYMYNLTTREIRHYKSSEDNWIVVGDQYIDVIGDSVHIRESEIKQSGNAYAWLMEMAPTSNGTKYK